MAKRKSIDVTGYEDKWVALDKEGTKVLVGAKTIPALYRKLEKLAIDKEDIILMFAPKLNAVWSM